VNRWRIWWLAGGGETPSEELVAAANGLNGRALRNTRRLVRRGAPAEGEAQARYAIAFARERQRIYAVSPSYRVTAVILAILILLSAGLAFAAPGLSPWGVAAFAALPVLLAYLAWRTWQERAHIHPAEEINRAFLLRTGDPLPTRRPSNPGVRTSFRDRRHVPPENEHLHPPIGLLRLATLGESLSPGKRSWRDFQSGSVAL
jgi:hypothetical protein